MLNPVKLRDVPDRTQTGCLRSRIKVCAGSAAGAERSLSVFYLFGAGRGSQILFSNRNLSDRSVGEQDKGQAPMASRILRTT